MDSLEVDLELKANEFRQQNGLNPSEAIRLKSLLLKNNVLSVFLPLNTDFSGMAVKMNETKKPKRFMLVNCTHTLGRQHFTICHELYHLYIQENFKSEKTGIILFDKQGDPDEYKANIFASYLLLPTNGILQMTPKNERKKNKITLRTILSIEQYYSSSRSALLTRLLRMGLIDKTLQMQFAVDKIKNAMLYGFPTDLYQAGNEGLVIGNYGTLAREVFDKGLVSESAYFSLLEDMGIDLSDFDNKTDNE
jgi:Zn-dependent peptidase ImmA (M78 family)